MERDDLASFACRSTDARGRAHPEQFTDDRAEFERDRDRVIHCSSFRRLEYKTQVFVNHEGDYYRTRLTHSLEAAQIARSIARRLRLNEELVECLALAHDLGHTPFGHSGERVLHRLMQSHGGFDHNIQSLRVVTTLENRYPTFPGLNLTWVTREGILKHSARAATMHPAYTSAYGPELRPPVEAQLIDIADEIAYNNHDIDDGLERGLILLDGLADVPLWRDMFDRAAATYRGAEERKLAYKTISTIIGRLIEDVVRTTQVNVRARGIQTLADVRESEVPVVAYSAEMAERSGELKSFLFNHLYRHPRVVRMAEGSERIIEDLFHAYVADTDLLPPTFQARLRGRPCERVVSDYIAGMTDRFARQKWAALRGEDITLPL